MQRHDNTIYTPPKKPKKIHTTVDCDRLQQKSSNFFLLHRLRNAMDSGQDPSLVPSLSLLRTPQQTKTKKKEDERTRAALNFRARNFQLSAHFSRACTETNF
jgi:hypothetical protein